MNFFKNFLGKNKSITLDSIGKFNQHETFDDWWVSDNNINIPLLDRLELPLTICTKEGNIDDDIIEAINNFLELKNKDKSEADKYIFKNYKEFVDAIGDYDLGFEIENKDNVWQHIKPQSIYVKRRTKDNLIYIIIAAECDWEVEHGLQIVYKNGNELSRVSDQDGHLTHSDAFGLPDCEDRIC